MDFIRRVAVNLSFGDGDVVKHRFSVLFDPFREPAAADQLANFRECPPVFVGMFVVLMGVIVVGVMMVVMIFDEIGFQLLDSRASLELKHGVELMRFGKQSRRFEMIATIVKRKSLAVFVLANCVQSQARSCRRCDGLAFGVEEVETESRRHVLLEHADFNLSFRSLDQLSAV